MEYIINQQKYQETIDNLKENFEKSFESQVNRGILSACGINVLSHSERVLHQNKTDLDCKIRIHESNIVNHKRDLLKTKDIIWIRDELSTDESSIFTPTQAEDAIQNGKIVYVEKAQAALRKYSDIDYALVGCLLVPSGSWKLSSAQIARTQFYPLH